MRNDFSNALSDNLLALKILGVEVNPSPTRREADIMFEQVKNEILAVGFDEIMNIPRTSDPKTELAVILLNDAGTPAHPRFSFRVTDMYIGVNAYWSPSPFAFADIIGLTVRIRSCWRGSNLTAVLTVIQTIKLALR